MKLHSTKLPPTFFICRCWCLHQRLLLALFFTFIFLNFAQAQQHKKRMVRFFTMAHTIPSMQTIDNIAPAMEDAVKRLQFMEKKIGEYFPIYSSDVYKDDELTLSSLMEILNDTPEDTATVDYVMVFSILVHGTKNNLYPQYPDLHFADGTTYSSKDLLDEIEAMEEYKLKLVIINACNDTELPRGLVLQPNNVGDDTQVTNNQPTTSENISLSAPFTPLEQSNYTLFNQNGIAYIISTGKDMTSVNENDRCVFIAQYENVFQDVFINNEKKVTFEDFFEEVKVKTEAAAATIHNPNAYDEFIIQIPFYEVKLESNSVEINSSASDDSENTDSNNDSTQNEQIAKNTNDNPIDTQQETTNVEANSSVNENENSDEDEQKRINAYKWFAKTIPTPTEEFLRDLQEVQSKNISYKVAEQYYLNILSSYFNKDSDCPYQVCSAKRPSPRTFPVKKYMKKLKRTMEGSNKLYDEISIYLDDYRIKICEENEFKQKSKNIWEGDVTFYQHFEGKKGRKQNLYEDCTEKNITVRIVYNPNNQQFEWYFTDVKIVGFNTDCN
ncbi:hypothetical protein [Bernardetia sp.]|uniref:hypothetical protein n=1 Tax=Bernardetia sp. TaxID=1937974 RepID=UPI0025BADB53|nr:hypothetical protein [Bernardetia sp.]